MPDETTKSPPAPPTHAAKQPTGKTEDQHRPPPEPPGEGADHDTEEAAAYRENDA